jgi:hypothetical protein
MKGDRYADYRKIFSFYDSVETLKQTYDNARTTSTMASRFKYSGYTSPINSIFPATYPKVDALTEFISKMDEYKAKIDTGGATKKARIKLSEDKRFTFSFDLASKGLYRVVEYYSDEVKNELGDLLTKESSDETEISGIVPPDLVQSQQNNSGDIVFFYKHIFDDGSSKEFLMRRQQKGSAYMLTINPNASLKIGDDGIYYADPVSFIFPNGKQFALTFSTTFRKIYLEQTQKGGSAKKVDIYIPFDMVSGDVNYRATPAIPLLILSEFFAQARIRVRISIMRPITLFVGGNNRNVSIVTIPIKDFDEPIDWNKLGVLRGMSSTGQALTEMNSFISSVNIGRQVDAYADDLLYDMADELQYEFGQYRNWFYQEVEAERIKSQLVPKPLMIVLSTEGLLGRNFVTDPTDDRVLDIDDQFKIDDNVFLLMDMVDFYFNNKTEEVVKRIWERFERIFEERKSRIDDFFAERNISVQNNQYYDNSTKQMYDASNRSTAARLKSQYDSSKMYNEFNNYLNLVISRLFKDSFPDGGVYPSSPEELKDIEEKYLKLLKRITAELPKYKI